MATNARTNKNTPAKRTNSQKRKQGRQKLKLAIFGIELAVILIMVGVLYLVLGASDKAKNVQFTTLDEESLSIQPEVEAAGEEGGAMHGYMNIALFGVDAKQTNELYKGSRSDTTMIASINMDTGDIKLVSVYRDTYLNLGNDLYSKCNGAYSRGGAEQAVGMLNMNLDMNITDFVTVGYAALAKVIDGVGGVWIDVDDQEILYLDSYQYSILGRYAERYLGKMPSELDFIPNKYFKDYDVIPVKKSGYQLLNGLQAAAYCRIRYVGNDFQRTERQREVIKAIESQAKQMDAQDLVDVFESVSEDIYTSLDFDTIVELLPHIANYRIVDESGFPELDMRKTVIMGNKGSCELPLDLATSVKGLHQFLFDDQNYEPSKTLKEISSKIVEDGRQYDSNFGQ